MFRKSVLSVIVVLCALIPAAAQNYTTDAILKNTTGKIATLECSGIARTKKEATEMAKKSVIYTYLYNGIDGLNDNKPLLGYKPSADASQYVARCSARPATPISSAAVRSPTAPTRRPIRTYRSSRRSTSTPNRSSATWSTRYHRAQCRRYSALRNPGDDRHADGDGRALPQERPVLRRGHPRTIRICAWPFRRSTKVSSSRAWRPKTC